MRRARRTASRLRHGDYSVFDVDQGALEGLLVNSNPTTGGEPTERGGTAMTPIEWTPAMSVGMAELDDDHKQLIQVINQLAENASDQTRSNLARQCLTSGLGHGR